MGCTILVNRETCDVLHDEVGQSIVRCSSIEQARDVRVVEAGQDLSLVAKMTEHRVGVHAAFDQLDCDLLLVLLIRALGQIDRAHSAAADFANNSIRAD